MMQLDGVATINGDHPANSVHVSLDLSQGRCLISDNSASSTGGFLGLILATMDEVFLENVRLKIAGNQFSAEKLGPFFLSFGNQAQPTEDKGISGSGLAVALGISANIAGVNEVDLTPFSSKLDFQVMAACVDNDSEVLFHCDPRVKFDCTIKLDGEEVRLHTFSPGTVLSRYVRCVSSNLDLSNYSNELRTAVSLFLRRRAFLHFVRSKSKVSVNLSPPDQAISYGVLVGSSRHYDEVLEKMIEASLHHRNHFFIEALSNPGTLEVRLLNAFVHLEIVDGGRTLSGNRVASALNIKRENADALVCMRNVMIHDGLGVREALAETRQRLKARPGGKKEADVIEQAFGTSSPHGNFYAAVMDAFSRHLAREVGISSDWIKRKVALSL